MRYVFGRRARALCSWGNGVRSLWAFFLWEKAPLSVVPFSRENWCDHLPPAARVQPLLRKWRDWICGDRRWSLRTSLERNFSSRARQRLTRVNCGRKMYCLLHLLIQQEVLCWLMVGWWRRRGYFWAFSACLPRDVELLEVRKRALLLGKPTVESMLRPPLLRAPVPRSSVARLPLI